MAAGFPADHVVLLPTDHAGADAVLRGADLGMVYGGAEVVARYRDSQVLPQGPGRSKILITADTDWRGHLDVIVESVADHGGTGCVNTSAVFIEGDPGPLAEAIAERLAGCAGAVSDGGAPAVDDESPRPSVSGGGGSGSRRTAPITCNN